MLRYVLIEGDQEDWSKCERCVRRQEQIVNVSKPITSQHERINGAVDRSPDGAERNEYQRELYSRNTALGGWFWHHNEQVKSEDDCRDSNRRKNYLPGDQPAGLADDDPSVCVCITILLGQLNFEENKNYSCWRRNLVQSRGGYFAIMQFDPARK